MGENNRSTRIEGSAIKFILGVIREDVSIPFARRKDTNNRRIHIKSLYLEFQIFSKNRVDRNTALLSILFGQQPGGRQRQGETGQVAQGQGLLEENPAQDHGDGRIEGGEGHHHRGRAPGQGLEEQQEAHGHG